MTLFVLCFLGSGWVGGATLAESGGGVFLRSFVELGAASFGSGCSGSALVGKKYCGVYSSTVSA